MARSSFKPCVFQSRTTVVLNSKQSSQEIIRNKLSLKFHFGTMQYHNTHICINTRNTYEHRCAYVYHVLYVSDTIRPVLLRQMRSWNHTPRWGGYDTARPSQPSPILAWVKIYKNTHSGTQNPTHTYTLKLLSFISERGKYMQMMYVMFKQERARAST